MKPHFALENWWLSHGSAGDFSRCSWRSGGSPAPLLALRLAKLVFALAACAWSLSSFWGRRALWFLYMTHWGISAIALQSALGLAISLVAVARKFPEPSFGLPWYVKAYWVLFNISAPVAFLITLFYWIVLYGTSVEVEYAPNPVLDVALHGLNSVAMLAELLTASHPSRALHAYQPVGFGLLYLVFGVVYYLAGGTDPWGNAWIYPVIDWSKPGPTTGVVAATTVVLFLLHFLTVWLARMRDSLAARILGKQLPHSGIDNRGFVETS